MTRTADKSLNFNASEQHIMLPANNKYEFGTKDFTIEAWIKPLAVKGRIIASTGDHSSGFGEHNEFQLYWDGEALIAIYNAPSSGTMPMPAPILGPMDRGQLKGFFDSRYHHIAYGRNAGKPFIYMDGFPIACVRSNGLEKNNENISGQHPLLIGGEFEGPSDDGALEISELRLWSCARSQTQVETLMYHELDPATVSAKLVGLWHFDDEKLVDSSFVKNNGELCHFDSPKIIDSGMRLIQANKPFLLTQTQLMEDSYQANKFDRVKVTDLGDGEVTIEGNQPGKYLGLLKDREAGDVWGWANRIGGRERLTLTEYQNGGTCTIRNSEGHYLGFGTNLEGQKSAWACDEVGLTEELIRTVNTDGTISLRNVDGDALFFNANGKPFLLDPNDDAYLNLNNNVYRTVISAFDRKRQPYSNHYGESLKVRIWTDNAKGEQVTIDGESQRLNPLTGEAVEIEVNALGVFTVTQFAHDLTVSNIYVQADFMAEGEKLLVSPAQHLYHRFSKVTAKQLCGEVDEDAPITDIGCNQKALLEYDNKEYADCLASAFNNLYAAADEHVVSVNEPEERLRLAAVGGEAQASIACQPHAFNRYSDLSRSTIITSSADSNTYRVLNGDAMNDSHFELHFDNKTVRSLDGAQVKLFYDSASSVTSGNQHAALLRAVTPSLAVEQHMTSEELLNKLESQPRLARGIFDDIWESISKAVSVVVNTVTKVVTDVVSGVTKVIKTVVLAIKDELGKIVDHALDLVEDVLEVTKAILKKIALTTGKALDFFKKIIGWDDIVEYQVAGVNYVNQMLLAIEDEIPKYKTKMEKFFDDLDKNIAAHLQEGAQAIDKQLGLQDSGAKTTPVSESWLHSTMNENLVHAETATQEPDSKLVVLANDLKELVSGHSVLAQKVEKLTTDITDVDGISAVYFANLIEDVVSIIIEISKQALGLVFDVVAVLFEFIRTALNARINIPIITSLYENVLMDGQQELTMLNFMMLLAAGPALAILKLAFNGELSGSISHEIKRLQTVDKKDLPLFAFSEEDDSSRAIQTKGLPVTVSSQEGWRVASLVLGGLSIGLGTIRGLFEICLDGAAASKSKIFGKAVKLLHAFTGLIVIALSFPISLPVFDCSHDSSQLKLYVMAVVAWILKLSLGLLFVILAPFSIAPEVGVFLQFLAGVLMLCGVTVYSVIGLVLIQNSDNIKEKDPASFMFMGKQAGVACTGVQKILKVFLLSAPDKIAWICPVGDAVLGMTNLAIKLKRFEYAVNSQISYTDD